VEERLSKLGPGDVKAPAGDASKPPAAAATPNSATRATAPYNPRYGQAGSAAYVRQVFSTQLSKVTASDYTRAPSTLQQDKAGEMTSIKSVDPDWLKMEKQRKIAEFYTSGK